MKVLVLDLGGRPLTNDDLVVLQSESTASVAAPYTGHGAFIISGCEVTGTGPNYNVGAGIVFIDGEMMRFYGAGAVTLPAQFQRGGFEVLDQRTYQTGGTKTCIRERIAVLVPTDPTYTGEYIALDTWGGKRWEHVQKASVRNLYETQIIGTAGYNANNYDANGIGKPGTEAWGWMLANGYGSTDAMQGLTIAGADPASVEYAVGHNGGQSTIQLMTANLPPNPPGTKDVAAFTGSGPGNLTPSGSNGWAGQPPPAGSAQPIDIRSPYRALIMRQWVGY